MKVSGSHFKDLGKEMFNTQLNPNNQSPSAGKNRLEDILNELISLEEVPAPALEQASKESSEAPSAGQARSLTGQASPLPTQPVPGQTRPKQPLYGHSDFGTEIPAEIARELALPASAEGIFKALKSFQQNNRNNPLISLPGGRVFYVEYDLEMERIRLFLGNRKTLNLKSRGLRVSSGFFLIEQVFEYKTEGASRSILGFSRHETKILEKTRAGRELLSSRESADPRLEPLLYFVVYSDRSAGISTCSVKADYLGV